MASRRSGWAVTTIAMAGFGLTLSGCAAKRPVLYPNDQYKAVGAAVAERDVDECVEASKSYRESAGKSVATETAKSGAIGGATGAAVGAIRGRAGIGAAIGAAGAGTAAFMRGLFDSREPDHIQQGFVNLCLGERGYRTLGWR